MTNLSPLASVRNWYITIFFSLAFISQAFSQSNAVNNAPPANYDATFATPYIRHETDNQNQIIVPVTPALPSSVSCVGGACGAWTVTVAGVGTGITSVTGGAGATNIIIILSGTAPVVKVGNAVRVSYTGSAALNSFTNRISYNARPVQCSDFTFAAFIDASLSCAPVTPASQMVFSVIPGARNSQRWAFGNTTVRVLWNSPSLTPATGLAATETDIGGAASVNTYFVGFKTTPATYTYPAADPVCGYTSAWNMRLTYTAPNGFSGNCPITGAAQNQAYASYNNDDTGINGNGNADVLLPPTVTNGNRVCVGNNVSMTFSDGTNLNCNPAVAPAPVNDKIRWVRVVYGSTDWGPGNTANDNIPNIRVNGVPVTTGTGLLSYPGGYYPVSPATTTFGSPDAFGVVQLATPVSGPRGLLELITTSATAGQVVGQRFYVRIDYWNTCNPYDGAGDAGNVRKSVENYIELIGKPVPLTTAGRAMCFGEDATGVNFTVASSIGAARTAVNWYATRALVGTATKMNLAGQNNSLTFPVSSYGTKGGVGGAFSTSNANGKYYSVWATQVSGATNTCESDPVEVVIFQQPQISNPTTILGEDNVCNGPPGTLESYSTNAAGTKNIAITTSTNPAQVNFTLENVWSQTFPSGVSLSATTGTTVDATYNIAAQPNPNATGDVQVLRQYRTSQPTDVVTVTSPLSAPAVVPPYNISPLACATTNTKLTVNVWGQSDPGSITGTKPICDGSSTGTLTVTGRRGKILFWERSFNSTVTWTNIGNANNPTFSETLSGVGVYRYRVTVQNQDDTNGPCNTATTALANVATITVNPIPTKPTITPSAATTFCLGGTVTLTAASTNAASYKWYKDGVATGATGAAIVVNTIAGSGSYTVEGIGIATTNCVSPLSNPTVVTVNPLPAGNVAGGGSICAGNPAPDIVFTFTAGSGPWDLVYSIDGVAQPIVNNVTSPYSITNPVVGVYRIVSINDNNNCSVTAPHANITFTPLQGQVVVGAAPPAFTSAPALVATAVCSAGAGTTDPAITFALTAGTSTPGADYEISYQVNGVTQTPKVFRVSAAGAIVSVGGVAATTIGFTENTFNNVGTQTLRILAIKSPSNCQTVINQNFPFTINPLPVGISKTLTAACSPVTLVNLDIFNTSVATAAGGNNVASTFSWTAVYNGLTGMPAADLGPITTISGTLTNPTNTPRSAVFTITPTSTATPACGGGQFTITVPVNPRPAIPDQTTSACSGTAFTVPLVNGNPTAATIIPANTTYTWVVTPHALVTGESSQPAAQTSITQTLTNTTNVPQTVHYVVTPTGPIGPCAGASFNLDVTVNPKPVIPPQTTPVCSGVAFNVAPANGVPTAATIVPANTTYTWLSAPAVTGGVTGGSAASGQTSISQTLTNPSTSQQTATYNVTPTSGAAGLCVGSNFTVTVTVNPIPVLNTSLTPPDICSGTFNYTPNSFTAGTTYSWSRTTPVGISEAPTSGTGAISDPLTNVTTSPIDVTYTVIATANSCPNTGQNVVVRVNPTPIANPVLGPANVCAGTTNPFFYSVTQHAGATYSWEIPAAFSVEAAGGGATPGGGPGPFTADYFILLKFNSATPPGGLPIKVIEKSADGCPGAVNTLTIVAATSPPTVPITGPASVCKSQTGVVFSVPQNASSTFTWSVGAGASIVGPAAGTNLYQIIVDFGTTASTTVDVTETNITGCPANYPTKTVTMVTAPDLTPTSQSICSGSQPSSAVNLNTLTTLPSTFSWFVSSIDPNITGAVLNQVGSGPLEHFPPLRNTSGTNGVIKYKVTPTATAAPNCIGITREITVTVNPEPVVTAIPDQSFCPLVLVNGAASFHFVSNVVGATMNWTSSNPAIGLAAASGTGDIVFTAADNTTGVDITSTIVVTATSNGCTSIGANSKTFTITIKPRPVVTAITDITVCPGDAVAVPAFTSNTAGGETYAWTNDNAAIGLALSGSGNIAGYFAPANNTGADVVGNLSVTSTRLTCAGPARTFKITIKPQPVVTAVTNKTFCPGDPIAIPLASNVVGATINWANSNTSIGLAASGSGDISGTAPVNNTGADIVGTITVSAIANSCTSAGANVKTFTITIKPTPIVNTVTDIVVCSGANIPATTFGSNIVSGGVTFNWTNSNPAINLGAGGTGNLPAFTAATNVGGTALVGTISVTGTKNSCSGPAMVFTITVNPEPVVTAVPLQEFCPGDPVSIPLTSNVGGATINWANSNTAVGLVASGTGNIAFTAPANNTGANIDATVTVTATANSCTSTGANSKTFTLRIKPTPIVNTISDVTVCSGAPISMIAFSANTGGSEAFTWNNDNTAVGLLASGTGNIAGYTAPVNISGLPIVANITVSASKNGCSGPTKTFKITVNPEPVVTAITNKSFCPTEGVNIPFTSNVAGATISWTNSNTAIGIAASGTGDIVYVAPTNNTGADVVGIITVTATSAGCTSSGANSKTFNITIKPTPIVTTISNITVCSGGMVTVPNFASNIGAGGVTFNWLNDNTAIGLVASGTGDITAFPAATNTTSTSIVATISVSGTKNSCTGPTKTFTITVLPEPVGTSTGIAICSDAAVGVNLSTLITSGAPANKYNVTITNAGGLTAMAGSPADGVNLNATEIQDDKWRNYTGAPHDIVYHITPISGGSPACTGATFDFTVTINPEPVVTAVAAQEFCPGDAVNIALLSNVAGATINWSNNNTSIGLLATGSGDISFTAPANNTGANIDGTITVTATKDGCTSTGANIKTFTIRIKPTPIVNAVADITVCSGGTVPAIAFTANTGGGETFSWINDNTGVGVAASGNGTINSYTAPVNVSGLPIVANITVSAVRSTCSGPTKTFKITINPEPVVTAITDKSFCPTDGVNIPFTSNVAGATISWTNSNTLIGIGASGTGDIVFVAPANNTGADIIGTITVTASKDGCTSSGANSKIFQITIKPTPIVTAISNITVCSGGMVTVPNFASNIGSGGVTFNWLNDNTAIGLVASGTGNITAFASAPNTTSSPIVATISVSGTKNLCTGPSKTFTITVLPEPVGTSTGITICSDAAVGVNLSTLITGGAAANKYNITITNTAALIAMAGSPVDGINLNATEIQDDKWRNYTGVPHDIVYHITPISGGSPACTGATFDFTVTISPEPVVTAITNVEFCPGDAVNVALLSNVAGATLNWTNNNTLIGLVASGSGDISFTAPANNTGANIDGTITVSATKDGCTSTGANIKTFTIRIKPTPIVNTIADVTVCSGGAVPTVAFTANTGGSETFSWLNDNTGVGLVASGTGTIVGYTAPVNVSGLPIVATITVSAVRNSCAGPSKTFKITINPEPVVTAITDKTFCPTESINIPFTSNVAGASISWTNSNTLIGIGASGTGDIVFVAPANNTGADITGTITVTASKDGCTSSGANTKSFQITIKPTPIVNAISNITVCSGGMINVPAFGSNIGSGGVTFNWANDNTLIGLVASGTGNITAFPSAPNTTSSPIVATIGVTGVKNLCSGPTRTFTITVLPEPVGTTSDIAICSDAAVGVNLSTLITGGAAANRFNITITNAAGLSASAGAPVDGTNLTATEIQNDKWTNQTGVTHDIVYHITPISGGSPACSGATFDLTVHVNPEPVVNVIANQAFCPGESINIALASNVAGANMSWSNSNLAVGLGASGTGDISYTAPANNTGVAIIATITVSAELNGCTSAGANRKTFEITIKPTPIVDAISNVVVCSGAPIATINFTANTGGGESFAWTNDNVGIGIAANGATNIGAFTAPINVSGVPVVANIAVTATRLSCVGPVRNFQIIVNPEPVVTAITDKTFCPGEAVNIPFTSNVASAGISWTNDNTLIGIGSSGGGDIVYVAPINNTGADIVGNIVVSASKDGCTSAGLNAKTFKITIKPTPIVNAITNVTVCSGGAISAITFGSNIASGGVTFNWANDNTAVGLAASGSGDISAFTAGLNLTSTPMTATVSVTGVKNGCSGPTRTFTITVLPQPVGTTTAVTVCSDAAVAVNLNSLISGSAAKYDITITNTAGLLASAGSPANVVGATASEVQDDRWTNWTGTAKDIVYHIVPTGPGSPGCVGAMFDLTVHVNPEPVVTAVLNQEFCPGATVNIPLTSNVAGASITWTNTNTVIGIGLSGSGDISFTAPANNTGSDIVGTITVNASLNGCQSSGPNTKTFTITIKPTPIVNVIPNVVVCSGAPIATINFSANTAGGETFAWTNNNTSIGLPANGTTNIPGYTAPANFTGVPIVATIGVSALRNSCPGPVTNFTITVNPEPVVTAVVPQLFCPGESVNIPLTSNVVGATINWTNSNGSIGIGTSGSGSIVYTAPSNNTGSDIVGTIVVNATKDGCTSAGANSKTFTITIKPTPIVNPVADITVCSGQTVNVPAFSSNVVAGGVTFDWTNDNPGINLLGSGTGDITSFTAATNITGSPMIANITVKGTKNTCSGPLVSFRIIVNPEPVVTAITDKEYCPGSIVNIPLSSNVPGALISWTNSNSSIGIGPSGTGDILYTAPTNVTGSDFVATITVTASLNSCTSAGANAKTFQITIKAAPVVTPIASINVCSGDMVSAINFTSNADPSVVFDWTNDNAAINLAASGTGNITGFAAAVNTGGAPMIANIKVHGTKNGCTGVDATFVITVFPEPVLGTTPIAAICSRANTNITLATNGTSIGAQSYRLDQIEYSSNGGPFGAAAPAGFTFPGTNKVAGSTGLPDLVKNDLFTNMSQFTVTVRYTITPISASNAASATGCPGDAAQITIDVNPEPDLDNSLNPSAICSGETIVGGNPGYILKADPASVAATSFIIHTIFPNGLTPGPLNEVTGTGKPANAINDDSWINTTNAPVDVTYEISPVTGSCVGQKELVVVRVNPSPAMKDGLDRVVCNDTNSGIVLQDNSPTSVAAASFDIISITVGGSPITPGATVGFLTAAGTNATTGITTDMNRIRDDRFVNISDDRKVVVYTVVPISSVALNSCRGPAKTITLIVEPPIKSVSNNLTPTICSGEPVDITFGSPTYDPLDLTNPVVTFSYATLPSSINGATVGNNLSEGAKITDVLVNTTNAPISVHYRITPRAAAASNGIGCTGLVEDVVVIVEPKPRISPIANKNVCEGVPVNLTLTSTTAPSTGSIKILVTSTPDAEITGSTGATGPGVLFTNGAMIVDALSNSASVTKFVTYHLLVQNVDASDVPICDAGTPIDVTIGVTPTPVFAPIANFAICSGDSFNPIPINTDTETAIPGSTLVTWSVVANTNVSGESPGAGNSFSQVLFNNTDNKQAVVYSIKATNISNSPTCAATPMPLTVTVYPNPKAINIPTTINACNNGQLPGNPSVPFTIKPSTVAALGTTFDWPVPDNGSDPDMPLAAAGTNATTIPQVFVNNGGSQGTQTYQIKAHLTIPAGDNPIIDVGLGLDNVCEAQIESTMVVRVAPPVDGDIFSYDLNGAESSEVYLCRGATAFNYIAPVGLPNLRMDYEENGVPKTLTGAGQKAIPGNPTVTTTYLLKTVTDAFNCSVTVNKTLVVHVDEVDPTSSIVGPDSGCSPFTVTFQYNQVTGTNYKWNWADGTEEPIFTAATTQANKQQQHVFNTLSTSQSVTLHPTLELTLDPTKFQDGCKKTAEFDVTLFPTINASVFANKDAMCSDDVVAFTNGTVGTNLTHRWSYRVQGSTTELEVKNTPVASFQIPNTSTSNPLTYEVVYEATNLTCAAPPVVTPIIVYRGVDAHFSHTSPTLFIGGHSTMSFTNDSAPVDGGDFRYEWVFGLDANPGTANGVGPTFNLDYTTPGPKEVRLLVTNIAAEGANLTCQDEYVENITIAVPPLVADFKAIPAEACFPTDITVTENNATGDVFEWRVLDAAGTAGQSNANLPVFKIPSPGKYTIELTTRNTFTGDQKTATQDVIVYDLPMASFDFRPGLVYVPDTELLTYNFSDGATAYAWDFGDGATSDEKEPTHTYKVEGVYDITLIAQNDHGNGVICVDTLMRKVTAKQGGVTRVPNAFTPSPNGPSTSNGGLPGANSFNDVFLPQVKGAEEFNMQVYDRWGNLVFESNNSNIGWDGYDRHGKLMPAGVYVYKLTLRLSDGQRTTQVGDITMIR